MSKSPFYPQYNIYTYDNVSNIIKAINSKYINQVINQYQLMDTLNDCADIYFYNRSYHDNPSNTFMEKEMNKLITNFESIISRLKKNHTPTPGSPILNIRYALSWAGNIEAEHASECGQPLHYILTPRSQPVSKKEEADDEFRCGEVLDTTVKNLEHISSWASFSLGEALRMKEHNKESHARNKADKPLIELLFKLSVVYESITGRKPGVSKPSNSNTRTGPFLRFLTATLEPLDIQKSPEALKKLWYKIKKNPPNNYFIK